MFRRGIPAIAGARRVVVGSDLERGARGSSGLCWPAVELGQTAAREVRRAAGVKPMEAGSRLKEMAIS